MKSILQGKPLKHPLHPLLVHFPVGLFTLSLLLDVGTLVAPETPGLLRGASWCIFLGLLTSLLAAVAGFADYSDIPKDRPGRKVANWHMSLNLLMVAFYAVNAGMRMSLPETGQTPPGPLVLSVLGMALLSVSGYLGGHMIYVDGIGVGRHRRTAPISDSTLRLSSAVTDTQPDAGLVFVPVPEAMRLRDKESLRLEIDGQVIVLLKLEGQYHGLQEFCTHRFGPLSEGSVRGDDLECPWHRSCFNVRTGKVTSGPAKLALKTFPTRIRDGKVEVGVPQNAAEAPV